MKDEIKKLPSIPKSLQNLKKPPKNLYYIGNKDLLSKPMVSIVGTRRPSSYTKEFTAKLAMGLAKRDVYIVSGGAIGVDAIAHTNAFPKTILVAANSLDFYYPAINQKLISKIYKNALAISEYEKDFKARPYTFIHRNRLVVGLGEFLIVTEADEGSGSLKSVEYALDMGKKVYVLPHRLNESKGTQKLIKESKVEVIYDLDTIFSQFENTIDCTYDDEILSFCSNTPSLEEAVKKFGTKIYEYELEGKILIKDLKVFVA